MDPKIQINYVDTKNQLADLLTKGSFTRDEWIHLLRLFNIMSFSMFSCSQFSTINNFKTMSKKLMQEQKLGEEERVVEQSKPMMSLASMSADQSPTALGSSASTSLGTVGAYSSSSDRTGVEKSVAKGLNKITAGLKCGIWMQSRSPAWEPVAETTNKTSGTKLYHYNFLISTVDHLQKVYSNVRQSLSRLRPDEMLDIDVNAMIW